MKFNFQIWIIFKLLNDDIFHIIGYKTGLNRAPLQMFVFWAFFVSKSSILYDNRVKKRTIILIPIIF